MGQAQPRRGRPRGPSSKRTELLNSIRQKISSGHWAPGMRLPSCRELAKEYGVSFPTVRAVLKELERMRLLDVSPRRQAEVAMPSALPSALEKAVAVVLTENLADAMAWGPRRVIVTAAHKKQDGPLLIFHHPTRWRYEVPPELATLRVRAILLSGPFRAETLRRYEGLRSPVILLDQPGDSFNFHYVAVDNFKGAFDAASKLISLGHCRIAFFRLISSCLKDLDPDEKERQAGFEAACERKRLPAGNYRVFSCYRAIDSVSREIVTARPRFTAVLTANPLLAASLLKAAGEAGVEVPSHLSIATFRSSSQAYVRDWSGPVIDFRELGEKAAGIIERVPRKPEHIRIPALWHDGDTTGPPCAERQK